MATRVDELKEEHRPYSSDKSTNQFEDDQYQVTKKPNHADTQLDPENT